MPSLVVKMPSGLGVIETQQKYKHELILFSRNQVF